MEEANKFKGKITDFANLYNHSSFVTALAFNSDESLLASADSDFLLTSNQVPSIYIWDLSLQKMVACLPVNPIISWLQPDHIQVKLIRTMAFDAESKLLACANSDASIRIWELGSHKELSPLLGPRDICNSIQFAQIQELKVLISTYGSGEVWVWDVETATKISNFYSCTYLHFQPDESIEYIAEEGLLAVSDLSKNEYLFITTLFNLGSGKIERILSGHSDLIEAIAYSSKSGLIATSSRDKTIIIWNARTGERIRELKDSGGYSRSMNFSQDGRKLITWNWHPKSFISRVKNWDIERGKVVKATLLPNPITLAKISPNTNFIAFAQENEVNVQKINSDELSL